MYFLILLLLANIFCCKLIEEFFVLLTLQHKIEGNILMISLDIISNNVGIIIVVLR